MNRRQKQIYLWIHQALHSKQATGVRIQGEFYPVETTPSGVRLLRYRGRTFAEQNPMKQSRWARMAQAGHQITWVIRGGAPWGRIVDSTIEVE